jgi:hypothetical protein
MHKKYYLVFATNFKNENCYLAEWLNYHILVGVEHFYLYDQDGSEESRVILEPYEKAGKVTRHTWTQFDGTRYDGPTRSYQFNKNHLAFSHCARNYRSDSAWMMKIDVDEFLYPPKGHDSLLPYLKSLDYEKVKGLHIGRFNFGDNNHRTKPAGSVLESYIRREAEPSNHKDLANCTFLSNNRLCNSAHWWHYRQLKMGKLIKANDVDGIRINHYYTKSLEEYINRQNVSRGRKREEAHFIERNRGCNDVEDKGMQRFVSRIKDMSIS